jgi:hypothetical protein
MTTMSPQACQLPGCDVREPARAALDRRLICDAIRSTLGELAEASFIELHEPASAITCATRLDELAIDSLATVAFLSQLECEIAHRAHSSNTQALDESLDAALLRGITTIGSLADRIATLLDERASPPRGGQ